MQVALKRTFSHRGHRRAPRTRIGVTLPSPWLYQRERRRNSARRSRWTAVDHASSADAAHRGRQTAVRRTHHLDRRQTRPADARSTNHRVWALDRRPAGEMEISCQVIIYSLSFVVQARIYMAYSRGDGQWLRICMTHAQPNPQERSGQSFLSTALLINHRHAVTGSPLSINSWRLPDFRELTARPLARFAPV